MKRFVRRLKRAWRAGSTGSAVKPTEAELEAWGRVETRVEGRLMLHSSVGIACGAAVGGLLSAVTDPSASLLPHGVSYAFVSLLVLGVVWVAMVAASVHAEQKEFIRSHRLREAMRDKDAGERDAGT